MQKYKTLATLRRSRSSIDDSMRYTATCQPEPKRIARQYLESMFFEPPVVPEQAKYIQPSKSHLGR